MRLLFAMVLLELLQEQRAYRVGGMLGKSGKPRRIIEDSKFNNFGFREPSLSRNPRKLGAHLRRQAEV